MQLRMSPGGRTPRVSRRRPELPPSSITVTIPVSQSGASMPSPLPQTSRRPSSTIGSPVPPPIATTRGVGSMPRLTDNGAAQTGRAGSGT